MLLFSKRTETIPGALSYKAIMRLSILDVQRSDYGTYKCVAKNPRGETDGTIRLYCTFIVNICECMYLIFHIVLFLKASSPPTTIPPPTTTVVVMDSEILNAKNNLNSNGQSSTVATQLSDKGNKYSTHFDLPLLCVICNLMQAQSINQI